MSGPNEPEKPPRQHSQDPLAWRFETYDELYSEQPDSEQPSLAQMVKDGFGTIRFQSDLDELTNPELLAGAIGQTTLTPVHFDERESKDAAQDLDADEVFRIYLFLKCTTLAEYRVANFLLREDFRELLNVSTAVSQSTLNRIEDRLPDPLVRHIELTHEELHSLVEGSRWEGTVEEPPQPTPVSDGQGPPTAVTVARELRREVQRFIQLDRDESVTFPKDRLLLILALAGKDNIFPNEAAENLALKLYFQDQNPPQAQDLFYHLYDLVPERINRMFIAANECLIDRAEEYHDFGEEVEVAIDITDWLYFGEPGPKYVSGTKPGRNAAYGWKFATLSVVGTPAPLTIVALPLQRIKNANYVVRRLMRIAQTKFNVTRAYLDSGFYRADVVRALRDTNTDYIINARKSEGDVKDTIRNAIASGGERDHRDWGVGSLDDDDYLFTVKSKKTAKLRDEEADDPTDDWVIHYTNLDPEGRAEELANDYRRRWGIETSYRVIKHSFLPKSASRNVRVRSFLFNYAVTLYNMWVVANLEVADDLGLDLIGDEDDGGDARPFKAGHFLTALVDDHEEVQAEEVEYLSEYSEILQSNIWF